MNLEEALAEFGSWEIKDKIVDFTKATDEELLKTSFNLDLVSIEEALSFIDELKSRNLYERYYEMRRPKKKST